MSAGRHKGGPRNKQTDTRVASGRPERAGYIIYVEAAERLLDNGYEPLPIIPGQKRPAPSRWSSVAIDMPRIEDWARRYPDHGVGLRTGQLVGLDIDDLDADRAHAAQSLAEKRFGHTLVRVGQWPKRLLLYRTDVPFSKMKTGKVEILGAGQQFVAFGNHAGTELPYYWTTGETPLDVCVDDLPVMDRETAAAFLAELRSDETSVAGPKRGASRTKSTIPDGPVWGECGLVVDGRDAWMSQIAFHAVHDVKEVASVLDAKHIAETVWERFADSTDLSRPRQDGSRLYSPEDALRKVNDKLRLAQECRLPSRDSAVPEPVFQIPTLDACGARKKLSELLESFGRDVQTWHREGRECLPLLGIRATVGLGKSRAAREHLVPLAKSLKAEQRPHRILIFVPSHRLADETAASWSETGLRVAVLRGYERNDPITGDPMCRDIEVVRAALSTGLPVHETACSGRNGARCSFYDTCLKQMNLRDVANADVVVAPYDTLYTGLAFDKDDVALLLVDEGCWARAIEQRKDFSVEDIAEEPLAGMGNGIGRGPVGAMADLVTFRGRLTSALLSNGPWPVKRSALSNAGLSADDCRDAARLERWRLQDTGLSPGISGSERRKAVDVSASNTRILQLASIWEELASFLDSRQNLSGRIRIAAPDTRGRHGIEVRRIGQLHESLRGKPLLHLDATMRPELARTVLPDLSMETIDVSTPFMQVRHVQGSFGKSMLCPAKGLTSEEARRRENRLLECVNYVRWHARRVWPGRVLVVTYKSVETAFADIPNVEIAHFNAVAGLDRYKDVALLISIGRPLPPSTELEALAGAYFDHVPKGRYRRTRAGLRMRTSGARGVDVIRHEDEKAEMLRAAICDDELVQVIGRGRGVNRTADDPLEVHVLADSALPLPYDKLTLWEYEKPDVFQKMLLDGVAVDSPGDAAVLHPVLFGNEKQAQKEFERVGFKRQNPMNSTYREMSLKSAAYKRPGRGRSWQRAWWFRGEPNELRLSLERSLGELDGWLP